MTFVAIIANVALHVYNYTYDESTILIPSPNPNPYEHWWTYEYFDNYWSI